jgi:hypothetical protein
MSVGIAHKLKIRDVDDPLFDRVARLVNPPAVEADKTAFLPAYAGFNIGAGTDVDISYFAAPAGDQPWATPRNRFDRHLVTDELWVCTNGSFYVPMAPCREPDNPDDVPRPQDMLCFYIPRGTLFVVRPNVWHTGPWPAEPGQPVEFFMLLSGHRKAATRSGENVDHIVREFADGATIFPDVDERGRRQ